eukprot:sb/3464520/
MSLNRGPTVESDKPVSVISGHECAYVPDPVRYCDHLIEQVPPISTWGTHFAVVPLATRHGINYLKVIAGRNNTWVFVNGEVYPGCEAMVKGAVCVIRGAMDRNYEIRTSSPSLLVQLSTVLQPPTRSPNPHHSGSLDDYVESADPFMIIVPPIEQFTNSYLVTTPGSEPISFTNYINVIVEKEQLDGLRIDYQEVRCNPSYFVLLRTQETIIDHLPQHLNPPPQIEGVEWMEVPRTTLIGGSVPVSIGSHFLHHTNPSIKFGIAIYGWDRHDSYGYSGGLQLNVIGPEDCVPGPGGGPGDGIDNDCDLNVDEELYNSIDDDHDGVVDEVGFRVYVQLQSVSVTMTYDSSGNVDLHVPDTLVDGICGMCNQQVTLVAMVTVKCVTNREIPLVDCTSDETAVLQRCGVISRNQGPFVEAYPYVDRTPYYDSCECGNPLTAGIECSAIQGYVSAAFLHGKH